MLSFSKRKREDLGYDWHDTMKNSTFSLAGIDNVEENDIHLRKDSIFIRRQYPLL